MSCETVVRPRKGGANITIGGGSSKRITLDARTVAKINDNRPHNVVQPRDTRVNVTDRPTRVIAGNGMGVQGPPGPAGSGGTLTLPIGEIIHGLRAVRAADGELFHPDVDTPAHADQVVGVAIQSATSGTCNVRTEGPITEPSWTWVPGFVFCGADGVLTQSPLATGWLLAVGRAIDATTIDVDIDTPFMR